MGIKDYKEMDIWKKGIEIVESCYTFTKSFPGTEKFGLCSQMRRASVSIPSNIAEGFTRANTKEYKNFLHYSLGSCAELETQAIIAKNLEYLDQAFYEHFVQLINHESRMLTKVIKRLELRLMEAA